MKARALGMWANLVLAAVLMLAVWVLLVFVGSRPGIKALVDLSPQQRSTVDQVTIDLLEGLAGQSVEAEFHLFFDPPGEPAQDVFQRQRQQILARLRDLTTLLLRQYAFHGGGAVKVLAHDAYGDIAAHREAAQRFGVTDGDVVVVAVRQAGRPPRHRTLSLEADLGVVEVPESRGPVSRAPVPVLKDYKGEGALSSALKSLLVQGTPVVYFLNGNSHDLAFQSAVGNGYLKLLQMLAALGIDVRELDLRNGIVPKDATVVAVLEPRREFTDVEVRVLHDYCKRGGRLFLDYSWAGNPDWNTPGTELGQLFGFEVGTRPVFHLIVDPIHGDQVRGLDGNPRVAKLDLRMNPNHPITLRLARSGQLLQFDAARELLLPEPAPQGVRREPLLTTGPQGWLAVPGPNGMPDWRAPRELDSFVLGAVCEMDGNADAEGKPQQGIAVVTSGVFCNNVGMGINGDLAANIFNWLCDRRVLLDIRGSSYVSRHLQMTQQQADRIWLFLVVGVPGALLLMGLFVSWRRRRP